LVILIAFLSPYIWLHYQSWEIGESYRQFEKGFIDYLKKDIYGGKTPQETYEMYVSALRKGDIESASKYYWWDKQVKEQERLEQLKKQGELKKYIDDLPKWEEMKEEKYWDEGGKRYEYGVYEKEYIEKLPDGQGGYIEKKWAEGTYKHYIVFYLNQYANIWKLY
jgi:hypothetical protein